MCWRCVCGEGGGGFTYSFTFSFLHIPVYSILFAHPCFSRTLVPAANVRLSYVSFVRLSWEKQFFTSKVLTSLHSIVPFRRENKFLSWVQCALHCRYSFYASTSEIEAIVHCFNKTHPIQFPSPGKMWSMFDWLARILIEAVLNYVCVQCWPSAIQFSVPTDAPECKLKRKLADGWRHVSQILTGPVILSVLVWKNEWMNTVCVD